jgi:hypothetical protein
VTPPTRLLAVTLTAVLLIASPPARATLGEAEATVERDRQALAMDRRPVVAATAVASSSSAASVAAVAGVTVHELRSSTVSVREFATPSGLVFAVAWSGMTMPDLGTLLGVHHADYRAAAKRGAAGRGPRRVEAAQVVVETWGHARNLRGRAWLPALLPAGVKLDDLQ